MTAAFDSVPLSEHRYKKKSARRSVSAFDLVQPSINPVTAAPSWS